MSAVKPSVAFAAILFLHLGAAAQRSTATLPSSLDPRVQVADDPHYSWIPASSQPLGMLVVFIPGTGGKPKENMPFARIATDLGYHFISLSYPDSVAAQQLCSRSPDEDAYLKFRLAIFQGGDFKRLHVDRADSIEERLTRLLQHLKMTQAGTGWDQFLTPSGEVEWSKLVLSGQSQGGGHAYVIAKFHRVARVVMFSSPKDYSFYFNRPAKIFDGGTNTPLNCFFAFNHLRDNGNGCTHDQQLEIFKSMGLTDLGIADADKHGELNHAHLIYTNVDVKNNGFHGSVLNGVNTIIGQTPEQLLFPVWRYMLSEPIR